MRRLLIPLCLGLLLLSCSLERNNPLDPKNHDIKVPGQVESPTISSSAEGSSYQWVELKWTRSSNADGYYVYRGLSYDGRFENVATIASTQDTISWKDTHVYSGTYYYYEISAYNQAGTGDDCLEGPLSSPVVIKVP